MSFSLALALAAAVVTAAPVSDPALRAPEPGPEARAALRLIEAGQKEEGCALYLAQIREGTRDPWAFLFASSGCFETVAGYGEAFEKSLGSRPANDILVVLGRGILHASRSELFEAETVFRLAVAREPEMAPGWLLLGLTLLEREDYQASIPIFEKAVELSPELPYSRKQLRLAQMIVGVFDRLLPLLAAIPERWGSLPEPRVSVSGRQPLEVINGATPLELNQSFAFFVELLGCLPEDRPEKIRERLNGLPPTELDLWVPVPETESHLAKMVQQGGGEASLLQGAMAVEAWLQWSEALGRRDALLHAASLGIILLQKHSSPAVSLSIVRAWVGLLPAARSEADEPVYSGLRRLYSAALVGAKLYNEALEVLRGDRAWSEKADHLGDTALTWLGEGDIWLLQLEHDEALRAYEQARELAKAAGDNRIQGSAILGAANIHSRRLDNARALAGFQEARPLLEAAGYVRGQGESWVGAGVILLRLRRHDDALAAFAKARPLLESVHYEKGLGDLLQGEADINHVRGDNETALRKFREARDHFAAAGDEVGLGNAWLGEAEIRGQLGYFEVALKMLEEARAHSEKGKNQVGVGNAWLTEADHRRWLKQYDQALHAYREARRHHEAVDDRVGLGHAWNGEGEVLARLGDPQGALAAHRKAFELNPDNPPTQGYAALGEAKVLARQERWREAAGKAAAAAEFFPLEPTYLQGRVESLLLEQEALQALGDWDRAAAAADEAIQAHDAWRKTRITDAHRTREDVQIAPAYNLLIPLRIRQGREREALTLAEEARSRVLLDLLATRSRAPQFRPSTSLREEKLRLQKERARLEREIAQASDPRQRSELEMERRRVDEELEWNGYEQAAQGSGLLTSQPLDAEAIQALSREIRSPILLYYAAAGDVFGFLVRPDHAAPVVQKIAIPWLQMVSKARALAHDLANPVYQGRPEAQTLARELWDRLIQPFIPDLPPDRGPLVLVPHGPLHELPFEALLDPHDISLFRFWDVTVVPSVSALSFCLKRPAGPQPEDALLTFSAGRGLSLPEHEVARIAPFFNTVRPTEPLFSRYEEVAPGARYLFFATHSIHVENNQSETYLELLPGEDHDSRLSAAEIAAVPLQAELVTLAACDTSHGTPLFSDERLGLTRSFLIAGAAAVLATRWKMPEDSTTSRFLEDFFRAYRQGGPDGKGLRKDQALSEARRLSQQHGDPAQLWAGWVLVGDPR